MKILKTIRGKLFFWYSVSLIAVTAFFYLAVHIFALPHGNLIFLLLLIILALSGLFIIRGMTDKLTSLSSKIKTITSKNLNEKITDIESEDEIGELAISFNQLLGRLDESFKRERQFIGDVAHELKTPVATLKSGIELTLSKNRGNSEYRKAFEETLLDANRLTVLINNILDLAWLGAENSEKRRGRFSLSKLLTEIKEIAEKLAFKKQIRIKCEIEKNIEINGTEDKIFRAIINIIDNSIKYTGNKGIVVINLFKKNGRAVIEVKDNGIGIIEKEIPHIFDRFYRGSKTAKTLGSGLGLAIAKGIITTNQGDIKVASRLGEGTTVIISLPLFNSSSY